jgi:hypothetical protein
MILKEIPGMFCLQVNNAKERESWQAIRSAPIKVVEVTSFT